MTRYLLLTEFYPPDRGGIQASLEPLVAALGDELTVLAPQPAPPGPGRLVRSLFSGRTWPRWWWLVSWLRRQRHEGLRVAIFGHFSAATIAAALNCWAGLRYVILVHGNDLLSERRRWYVRPLIGWVLRRAEWVGVNSTYVADLVRTYRLPESRIIKTHPTVEAAMVDDRHLPSTDHRLLSIARLVPRKNIATVLRSVQVLRTEYPDLHYDVVGAGPERPALEHLAQQLGLQEVVTFHGQVEDIEKWRLLKSASTFILTPLVLDDGVDVEGLGLVYLEAAAFGLPIVASRTGGVADAVVDGETGFLVVSDDVTGVASAIRRLWSDPERSRAFGQAGRARVRREFTSMVRTARCQRALRSPTDGPTVSIVIPAYQSADTIVETLQSLEAQSYRSMEIIVVDDGSTDRLQDALAPWRDRLQLIRQENAGAPSARNRGADAAHGDFLLFLDADVVLAPEALAEMVVTLLNHPEADFAYSDFRFGWKSFRLHDYSVAALRRMNYIHTSSLIRRGAAPRFDPTLRRFQDWDLWLTMAAQGRRGIWIPRQLFRVKPRDAAVGMSTWLPSFVYRLPFIGRGQGSGTVAKYRQAEAIIRAKHHLDLVG